MSAATDELLARAAELRAAGTAWDRVADRLALDPDELQQLVRDAGPGFRRLFAAARSGVIEDGFAEAMFSLRKLLRADDDPTVHKAADCLARVWMTTRRHRRKAAGKAPVDPDQKAKDQLWEDWIVNGEERGADMEELTSQMFEARFGFHPDAPPAWLTQPVPGSDKDWSKMTTWGEADLARRPRTRGDDPEAGGEAAELRPQDRPGGGSGRRQGSLPANWRDVACNQPTPPAAEPSAHEPRPHWSGPRDTPDADAELGCSSRSRAVAAREASDSPPASARTTPHSGPLSPPAGIDRPNRPGSGAGWRRGRRSRTMAAPPPPSQRRRLPRCPMTPSYAHGTSSFPLLGETVGENLRRTAERFPGADALVVRSQGFRATYRELWNLSGRCARGLMARGVAAGDRVGIWSPNRAEWVVAQFAAARAGAILVNLNPAYRAAELEFALTRAGVGVLLLASGFRGLDYRQTLAAARPRCPDLREALVLDDDWQSLLAAADRVPAAELAAREAAVRFDDPVNIQYTSGTTGLPKAATLTHHNVLNNGFFTGERMGLTASDRVCVPVPFYHCFGMVLGTLACVAHGACVVVPGEGFDAGAALAAVAAERCTALYGVPTMFIAVLEHPALASTDVSSLRTGIMAGATCPVAVMRDVRERLHMPEVTICYGMTETSPVSTQTHPDDPVEKRVCTVGRVHPHVEVKVVDVTGRVVPRGEAGELCTRGYGVMAGYWGDPDATRAAVDAAGWMHTGDLGVMDADGYVSVVGRLKDVIIRGGENIAPREVEEYLQGHPAVGEAQVVGVPSARYGEEVMAWVRLAPGAAATAAELEAHCRAGLAGFKVPRHWAFVESFPLTATGKVQKHKLREAAAARSSRNPQPAEAACPPT